MAKTATLAMEHLRERSDASSRGVRPPVADIKLVRTSDHALHELGSRPRLPQSFEQDREVPADFSDSITHLKCRRCVQLDNSQASVGFHILSTRTRAQEKLRIADRFRAGGRCFQDSVRLAKDVRFEGEIVMNGVVLDSLNELPIFQEAAQ